MTAVPCAPITDAPRLLALTPITGTSHPVSTNTQQNNKTTPDLSNWAAALTSMTESISKGFQHNSSSPSSPSDKKKKAWDNLPDLNKEVILLAGTQDDLVKPSSPTDLMLQVHASGTGPRAQSLLHHTLKVECDCIVSLDDGLCAAIKNGLFLSQPTEQWINYYSPAFTAPERSDNKTSDLHNALRIMEQAALGKISQEDIASMTKQTVCFPRTYNSLKYTFKNFYSLTKILFGQDALLTQALAELYNHIHQFEIQYTKCFQ